MGRGAAVTELRRGREWLWLALWLACVALLIPFVWPLGEVRYQEAHRQLLATATAERDRLVARWQQVAADRVAAAEGMHRQRQRQPRAGWVAHADPDAAGGWRFVSDPPSSTPSEADQRLYRLSREGGEHYEFVAGDAERAVDAYSFFLARIDSAELRDRLSWAAARARRGAAGAASGDVAETPEASTDLNHTLADGMLERLLTAPNARRSRSELGVPVALLAGWALLERDATAARVEAVRSLVSENFGALPLAYAERCVKRAGVEGDDLSERLAFRRQLLSSDGASGLASSATPLVWRDDWLYLKEGDAISAQPLATADLGFASSAAVGEASLAGSMTGSPTVAIHSLAHAPAVAALEARPQDWARATVTLADGSTHPVAWLERSDPQWPAALASLARERQLWRWGAALLLTTIAIAGVVSLLAIFRLRRLAALRVRLLANVSHELRTPITSIRIFSELLTEGPVDPVQQQRFGSLLLAESQRLGQIVDDLLDFASQRRTQRPLPRVRTDIGALIETIAHGFRFRAEQEQVGFEWSFDCRDDADGFLETDATAVERVLLNLLDNALKYRRQEHATVSLRAICDSQRLRIQVRDNGVGIARADQPRVFEEFYRARYEEFQVRGAGLGLAISQRLATALGGRLLVESREGEGSVFTLELPRASEPGAAAAGAVREIS